MKNLIIFLFILQISLLGFSESLSEIKTPEELTRYLQKNYGYVSEKLKLDYWQSPKETIEKKGGDCEDFAFLTDKILKKLKYNSQVYGIEKLKGMNHAITVYKNKNGYYNIFSNQFLYYTDKKNIIEAIQLVYPNIIIIYIINPVRYGLMTSLETNLSLKIIWRK